MALRRAKIEQERGALLDSVRQVSAFGSRSNGLEAQQQLFSGAHDAACGRLDALAEKIASCRADFAAQAAVVDTHLQHSCLRDQLGGRPGSRRAELQERQSEMRQTIAEVREQRGAMQARRTLLEEFERRQEGLGVGVREILALAKDAAGPPWNDVLGHVVELLEVDLENAALLEVALGGRAQLIVLEDGRPLVDYLGEGNCRLSGRVGFLAIGSETSPPRALPRGSGRPSSSTPPRNSGSRSDQGDGVVLSRPIVSCARPREFTTCPSGSLPDPHVDRLESRRCLAAFGNVPASRAGSSRCKGNCSKRTVRST